MTRQRSTRARDRQRAVRAIDVRRRPGTRIHGRAWINGREVGGADPRYAHLARSHD